jgi:hypothetical protein
MREYEMEVLDDVLVKLEIKQLGELFEASKLIKEDFGKGGDGEQRKRKRLSRRYHTVLRKITNLLIWNIQTRSRITRT